MHPAKLILSTAAMAAPGPDARVNLPKKDLVGGRGLVGAPAGIFLLPAATAVAAGAAAEPTAAALATAEGDKSGGDDDADGPLVLGGQCRSSLVLKAGGGKGRTMLEAQCVDEAGQWWRTSLNLNRCIGTRNGELVYQESGDFDSLCWPCVIGDVPLHGEAAAAPHLKCTCQDHLGSPKLATLRLGPSAEHTRAVWSSDGRLVCGENLGDRVPLI